MLIKMLIKNALRHRLRTFLTILGIAVAISAFGFLRTVISAWYEQSEAASAARIIARNKVSIIFPLPLSYKEKIAAIPHVTNVTYANWVQSTYIDERNFFPQFAIDPDSYFQIYPEYLISAEAIKALKSERNAAIVGRKTAEKFGWKIGDEVQMVGTIYPGDWQFVIRGIYQGEKPKTDETLFLFNWEYLNQLLVQNNPLQAGQVGIYIMSIDNPDLAAEIGKKIDERFSNSEAETMTETENAFALSFVAMSDVIIKGIQIVSFVIIFIVLLVLANTMAMSVRERVAEYAVLKTLGFSRGYLTRLILGETFFISIVGGLLGLMLTYPLCAGFAQSVGSMFFPNGFNITNSTQVLCVIAIFALGLISCIYPIRFVLRTTIVDGLRQL